jgi:hypothetical protein
MDEKARILVVDAVLPTSNEPHPGKIMEILMMASDRGEGTHGTGVPRAF